MAASAQELSVRWGLSGELVSLGVDSDLLTVQDVCATLRKVKGLTADEDVDLCEVDDELCSSASRPLPRDAPLSGRALQALVRKVKQRVQYPDGVSRTRDKIAYVTEILDDADSNWIPGEMDRDDKKFLGNIYEVFGEELEALLAQARAEGEAAAMPLSTKVDVLNLLPPSHRAMLRVGYFRYDGTRAAYYVGRLKSFNARSGYGFLECARSMRDYGADVFIHSSVVPEPWSIGQPVEFAVMTNARGQPQASDVQWLPRLDRQRPGAGVANGPAGIGAGADLGTSRPPTTASMSVQAPAAPVAPRKLGILKSVSRERGYGFILSEEVFQLHGRDVYFDARQMPRGGSEPHLGSPVEFALLLNWQGQPQARDITWDPAPCSTFEVPGSAPSPGASEVVAGGPSCTGAGVKSSSQPRAAASESSQAPAAPAAHRKLGTLKSFCAERGYGFISCEEVFKTHGRDAYFDDRQMPQGSERRAGALVEFTLLLNLQGQPQARDINWDPVSYSPPESGDSALVPRASKGLAPASARRLQQLMTGRLQELLAMLHERSFNTALTTSIELQAGRAGNSEAEDTVDYVAFVLDRIGVPEQGLGIGNEVKLRLLRMLPPMLRQKTSLACCQRILSWFEHVSKATVALDTGAQVGEGLGAVLPEVCTDLLRALQANDLVKREALASGSYGAFLALEARVRMMEPPLKSAA